MMVREKVENRVESMARGKVGEKMEVVAAAVVVKQEKKAGARKAVVEAVEELRTDGERVRKDLQS